MVSHGPVRKRFGVFLGRGGGEGASYKNQPHERGGGVVVHGLTNQREPYTDGQSVQLQEDYTENMPRQ